MTEKQRNREEVVNTQLAILISGLGVTADAWVICKLPLDYDAKASKLKEHVRSMPTMHMDRLGAGDVVLEDARK